MPDELVLPLRVAVRPARETDAAALEWYGHQAHLRDHLHETLRRAAAGEVILLVAEANAYPGGRLAVGCRTVELRVEPWHDEGRAAQALYERLGYEPAGTEAGELVLRKELG